MATDTTTQDTSTQDTTDGTVLDLRPPADSIKSELHRLGLTYESTGSEGETWKSYEKQLSALIPAAGDSVRFTDLGTNISQILDLGQLKSVSQVITVAIQQ